MAAASYDQLLRQVEVLKMENSNLRQELQDNSNHLTKLETEASNMKVSTAVLWYYCRDTAVVLLSVNSTDICSLALSVCHVNSVSLSPQPRIDLWYFPPITRCPELQNELLVVVRSEMSVCV